MYMFMSNYSFLFLFLFFLIDLSNSNGIHHLETNEKEINEINKINKIYIDPTRIFHISWSPRAFLYKNFLSTSECDHLMNLAENELEKSTVIGDDGVSVLSEVRTSSGMFLKKSHDEIVKEIEERISVWTFLPVDNGEAIQILKYNHGEKYEEHFDFFDEGDESNTRFGGQRYATVLMYLSDVEKGGETVFPNTKISLKRKSWWPSSCVKNHLSIKPSKGDALLFFSLHLNATLDTSSLHTSCPVKSGIKWSATKWIHVDSLKKRYVGSQKCKDEEPDCEVWASRGECVTNRNFMVGEDSFVGKCRKSCNACPNLS